MNILEEILSACTHHMGFMEGSAKSNSRQRELVYIRNLFYKFSRKYTSYSVAQLGMIVNKKNHSTVLHGLHTIENDLEQNEELRIIAAKIEDDVKVIIHNNNLSPLEKMRKDIELIQKTLYNLTDNYVSLRNELQSVKKKKLT